VTPAELAEHQARWNALRGITTKGRGAFAAIPRAAMLPGETLAHYRALDTEARHRRVDADRAAGLVAGMPASWVGKLLGHWRQRHGVDHAAANLELLDNSTKLREAQRAGLQPDATDDDVCALAKETAREVERRMHDAVAHARAMLADRDDAQRERLTLLSRCAVALDLFEGLGLGDYFPRAIARARSIESALRRVVDDRFWRRVLRKLHARAVEATARALGLVHKRAGCYVSDDGYKRRQHQRARNAATLESVVGINDQGQVRTLAELAATGPANREIRRHELMTRIAGFEVIAKECGHAAFFITATCTSRMHAQRTTRSGGTEANPRFDGTTPDEAQRYLSTQWACFRAAADRAGLGLYGFRIAEPNHDATPHWHMLFFFPPRTSPRKVTRAHRPRIAWRVLVRLLRRYFLWNDSAHEPGARKHRVKAERIDWARGSAAGYVAKYVAKNIDGHHVERDLFGNDAIASSQRVEAWAATWRVRQFQQIGGAPVTVWRELRRLNELQGEASPLVAMAIDAANTTTTPKPAPSPQLTLIDDAPRDPNAADGWATYLHLQGGPRVRRADLRLRVLREDTGEVGRYGEAMEPRPVGIVAVSIEQFTQKPFGIVLQPFTVSREVRTEVESERCSWVMVPRSQRREVLSDGTVAIPMHPAAAGVLRAIDARRTPRPWSPVNNCTHSPIAGTGRRRVRKRGWVTNWRAKREGVSDVDSA